MRKQGGQSSVDLILSARVGGNANVFPAVLQLHVPEGSVIADVTYGKGVFWKKVPKRKYQTNFTDIQTGTDCRRLPYDSASIDCVVLDPPLYGGRYSKHGLQHGSRRFF